MSGEANPMYGKHPEAWNKGLTADIDERVQQISLSRKGGTAWNRGKSIIGHSHSEATKEKLRQIHLDPEFQYTRYLTMLNNNTLGIQKGTKAELFI